jgi:hypothetical protein
MKSSAGSSKNHIRNSHSQKRSNNWYSRNDLVTFEVFKREYWPHIYKNGIGVSSAPSSFTPAYSCPIAPSLAFSDFLGIVTQSLVTQLLSTHNSGTIKGSEKSLDYPNRALDREAYENLKNTHGLDFGQFEAYQSRKLKRGEYDLADR